MAVAYACKKSWWFGPPLVDPVGGLVVVVPALVVVEQSFGGKPGYDGLPYGRWKHQR